MTTSDAAQPVGGLPVFVGGLERSGTSLVRAMLGSSPDLAMYEWDWHLLTTFASAYGPDLSSKSKAQLRVLADEVFLDRKALQSNALLPHIGDLSARTVAGEFATYGELARTALEIFRAERGRPRYGMKRPYAEFSLDNLDDIFGDYYFVQIVRNPLDSFRSASAYGMRAIPEVWGRRWRRSVEIGESRPRDRHLMVRYEDLPEDREGWSRRFADFCELTWTPAMVTGEDHPGWAGGNSSFKQEGTRVTLDAAVAGRVAAGAGEAMDRWRYDRPPASASRLAIEGRIAAEVARDRVSAQKASLRRAVAARTSPG